jgi:hypothetical protein
MAVKKNPMWVQLFICKEGVMPKYKVSFEYETEVEADNEEDAIFNCSTVICEYMGDNAIVEEIEEGDE